MTSKSLTYFSVLVVFLLINMGITFSAVYYIDFSSGSDSNNGTTTSTPWKHCPGDSNASGLAAATKLMGGDTVNFKGGVKYKGGINLLNSGTSSSRIIYSGNNGWGTGKAIIDGTTNLAFTKCPDKATCDNDNWSNMYYTTLPTGATWLTPLFEDGSWLWFAQLPSQKYPFFYNNTDYFQAVSSGITNTQCTDPAFFTQADPNYYVGAYFMAHVTGNGIGIGKITTYDPTLHSVTYTALSQAPDVAGDWDGKYHYSVINHIHFINEPGKYAIDEVNKRIYLWPVAGVSNITISVMPYGFHLKGTSYNTIDGFIIDGQSGSTYSTGRGINASNENSQDGIIVQNCEIRNSELGGASAAIYCYGTSDDTYIIKNYVHHIRGRGMVFVGSKIHANENVIRNLSGTAIHFAGVTNGEINGNDIDECKGTHSNGISVYQNSANVVVSNNKILNIHSFYGPYAITHEKSTDLTFFNNIIDGKFYSWGPSVGCGYLRMYNNIITQVSYVSSPGNCREITWINNIAAGIDKNSMTVHNNNLYTALSWNQSAKYGWVLGTGEIIQTDLKKVFVDATNHNFSSATGSPAIGAGLALSSVFTVDIEGKLRSSSWDLGAYQKISGGLAIPSNLRITP